MADAVVGMLRAIMTLDTAQFEAGARKGKAVVTELEKTLAKLGDGTGRLTAQADRMVKALSGDRLLSTAHNLTAAVTRIGGASRLTEAEQARVNRTVSDAIAKYTALGHTAPAAMVALQRETAKSAKEVSLFSGIISKLGPALAATFSVGAIVRFAQGIGNFASRMNDLSAETGIGVERLQALNFIAAGAGLTVEDLSGAVNQLSRRLAGGDNAAEAAVGRLGFQVHQLLAMKPDEAFIRLGEAIAKIESPQERVRLAMELFGRSGARALRLMTDDLGDMVEQVEASGAVISKELIEKADRFDDAWAQAFIRWKANAVTAAGVVAAAVAGATSQVPGTFADAKVGGGIGPTPQQQELFDLQRQIDAQLKQMRGALQAPGVFGGPGPTPGAPQAEIAIMERRAKLLEEQIARTIEFEAAVKRLTDELGGANATLAVKQLEAALLRLTPAQYANAGAVADVLKRYEALRAVVGDEVSPVLEALFAQVGTLTGRTIEFDLVMRALPPSIDAAAESINLNLIPAMTGLENLFASSARMKAINDELAKLGMILPDIQIKSEGVSNELQTIPSRLAEDIGLAVHRITTDVSDSIATMLTGMRGFKDSMLDIWDAIRRGVAGVLSGMLQDFIGGYLRKVVAAAAGSALAGAGTGAAVGGTAAGLAGAGGAGGTGGVLANPAFWSNPWTAVAIGGAILGTLAWKKGWGRGGEEAADVNPRRDSFFGQLQARFGGSQFQAASKALSSANVPGSVAQRLIGSLYSADTLERWGVSQAAALAHLTIGGVRGLKSFAMGGFVPPNVVQPAILHGGRFGEDIVPRSMSGASGGITQHNTIAFYSQARDVAGFKREFYGEFVPELKMELLTNQHDLLTVLNQVKP